MSARTQVLHFDNASLLALKLFAFAAMVADHTDWMLSDGQGAHAGIGRLVFPIFGFLLAFNAARTEPAKLLRSVIPRLLLVGAIAQVPYLFLLGEHVPLNIMFTLSLALMVYALWQRGNMASAVLLLVVAGAFVDYAWYGVLGVATCAHAFRHGSERSAWSSVVVFCLLLTFINGNLLALLSVPVLWAASRVRFGDAPRLKWLFLAGYPLHLAILAICKAA